MVAGIGRHVSVTAQCSLVCSDIVADSQRQKSWSMNWKQMHSFCSLSLIMF